MHTARATASEAAPAHLLGAVDSRRALRVGAALVLLLWPWPGAGRVCSAVFALYADAVVQSLPLGSAAAAPRISSPTEAQRREAGVDDWTVMLTVVGPAADGAPAMPLGVRILGYTPFAILAALLVGTPVPWRRRLKIGALGAFILAARLAAAIAIPVARVFGPPGARTTAGVP